MKIGWMAKLFLLLPLLGMPRSTAVASPPVPAGVPNLVPSGDYRVWVNGREQPVYQSLKTGSHATHGIKSISFAGFDLAEPAAVRIEARQPIQRYELRPYSADIATSHTGQAIGFTLQRSQKLILTLNGSYDGVLALSANPPEATPAPETVKYYYGPGVHRIGIHKKLATGDSVYLAEGAVVMGSFSIENAENVHIFGRGIIANGDQPHQEDFKVIRGAHTKNVTIEGITICNSPGWIISFWNGSEGLTVRNVKMLGNWMYNTDGVQTGTRGLLVEDCLMECNDDNFSLNGDCRNVEIRNSLLWNICNGGVFMLGWGCEWLENFNIHDCVIFRAGGSHNKGPFAMILTRTGAVVKNIRFRNIVIEDIVQAGYWIDFKLSAPSAVRDIRFENIEILKTWRAMAAFNNNSAATPIENIRFNNIRIAGKRMETPDQGGLKLINTGPITIQGKVFGSLNTVIP